ncbi:MAG: nitrile hydratase subunit alpha [Gammaproteobacteria bacterium]|nr:nitrile hydratase subunit alpha [Gammaproteobacteria bacterium]
MSGHDHDDEHDHDHSRTFQPDHPEPTTDAARVGLALRELLIEAGHYTADEERDVIAAMQGASPENGAKIVARAWTDAVYRERLLANGAEAIRELGFALDPYEFTVMENSDDVHNVIVCTLCSCYPRALLGMSPAWYKSGNYRARVVREPRSVLREFGVELSNDVEVRVHDSTAELRYMVLPQRPVGTDGWTEEQLASLVTRDSLIGTQRELKPD